MIEASTEDLKARKATLACLSPEDPHLQGSGYLVLSKDSPPERIVRTISSILDSSSLVAAELGCASVLCGLTSDDAELGDLGVVDYVGDASAEQVAGLGERLANKLGIRVSKIPSTPISTPLLPKQLVSSTQSKVTPSLLKGLQTYLGALQYLHQGSFKISEDTEVYLLWGYKEGWLIGLVGVALVME